MALDPRKRQKKIERRKAKERDRKREQSRSDPRDLSVRLERAAAAPILHCCTIADLWSQGIGNVLVSRELASGNVAFVVFLVDMYCLGVKNVIMDVASRSTYDWKLYGKMFSRYKPVQLRPECARKLVEGAVAYASDLGLAPYPEYHKAKLIFGDIDANICTQEFVYGKDGKPLFVAGPHDTPARCQQIIRKLTDRCGGDGFHYLMPMAAGAMLRSLEDDDDDVLYLGGKS